MRIVRYKGNAGTLANTEREGHWTTVPEYESETVKMTRAVSDERAKELEATGNFDDVGPAPETDEPALD